MSIVNVQGTKAVLLENGMVRIIPNQPEERSPVVAELSFVGRADIALHANDFVRATIDVPIYCDEVTATPEWFAIDPVTGKSKQIKRIEYADGSEFPG